MGRKVLCLAFLAVLGLMLTSTANAKLVGWWKLDETAGTTAVDSSGNNYDGTLINGPVWIDGQIDGALQFDGTNDYLALPIGSLVSTLTSVSVTAWANFSQVGGGWERIFDFGNNTTVYAFLTPDEGSLTGNMRFAITTSSNGGEHQMNAPKTLATGWHHVAVLIDGTNGSMALYLDGTQVASGTTTTYFKDLGTTTQNWLGRSMWSDPYYNGALDDFRIYDEVVSEKMINNVIMAGLGPDLGVASKPNPIKKATDVARDVVLGWLAGPYAKTHDVYFGTDFADVNNATTAAPLGVLASPGQSASSFDPAGLLTFGQTYYWRVDEVNAAPDSTVYKGYTWNFTAETYGYTVKPTKATASSQLNTLTGPDKTIDGSGLDALDEHATSSSQEWVSKKNVTPIWIQYQFDSVYKLYQMWVWNSNQTVEPDVGFGAEDVTIETSLDGTTWTTLANVPEFAQATGEPNYVYNTVVDFAGTQAKYVKLTINSNWAGTNKQSGLSEVRFFYIPGKAYLPTPVSGDTGVAIDAVLNWRPGREVVKHEVYLGTDPNALSLVSTVTDHRCPLGPLGLLYGKTYYWKVNEVNEAGSPASWEGDVWSFSIPDYFVVDDFEQYNDKCKGIFWSWIDGLGGNGSEDCGVGPVPGNGSGATVGNLNPPFAEQTIVHGDAQSMPFFYDNSFVGYSEAVRTFGTAQDWTKGGVKTLVLYFRGASDNGAGQLYVKINNVKVQYTGNAAAITTAMWKQWNIDLTSVSGLQSVKTLTVGISGSGKGVLYIDDILLYRLAPAVVVPADPGTASLQAYYPMDGSMNDTSGHGNNGTLVGNQTYVDAPSGRGKAIQLNGTNDYADLPIGTLISTLSSTTITEWVNFTYGSGSYERVFDFGTGSTNYMFLSAHQGGTTPEVFGILKTGGTEARCTPPRPMGTGWHHLAVTIDSATMTMVLYLDGTAVATNTTTTLPKDLGKTTQNWLGRSQWTADAYYTGLLDDLRIYNRALSAGEVAYLVGARP